MKLKKLSILGLIIGIVAVLVAVGYLALMWLLANTDAKTIAIIGGADGPTAIFITSRMFFRTFVGILLTLGIPLVLTSLFCLIFPNFVQKNFSIKTSALALGLSATGCLGAYCLISSLAIAGFGLADEHPIAYPASIAAGVLALILFLILFALYCKARKGEVKIVGIILDVLTGALFLPFFFLAEMTVIEWIRDIFHLFA